MSYLVLARKWRPQTFEDVVGQGVATKALANALSSGRIHHAFLFTGARGVGKTTAARILAKSINCEKGPTATPCNVCPLCEEITAGRSVDVLEIDGASNTGVDDVRDLREKVKYLPARARSKVIIIDEVHMLSGSAFNALLKTLEEPPAHVIFVFATTEPHKIPATVLSRVQRYDFRRIAHAQVVERLTTICETEGVKADEEALSLIAREAEGSMRDALSLLDQAWSASSGGKLEEAGVAQALGVVDRSTLFGLATALLGRDGAACLKQIEIVFSRGHDIRQFTGALLNLLRDLAVARVSDDRSFFDRPDQEIAEMRGLAAPHEAATLYRLFDTLAKAFDEIARAAYPKLLLEMTLLRMAAAEPLLPIGEAVAKLEAIERRLGGGRIESPRNEAPRMASVSSANKPRSIESPPENPVPAPTASPALDDASSVYRAVIDKLRQKRRSLAAVFEAGRVLHFDRAELKIGFADAFSLEQVREPGSVAELGALLREALGGALPRLDFIELDATAKDLPASLSEERQKTSAEEQARIRKGLSEHPNVQAAQDVLGAKLLEVRLEPR